jgi:hypothetical protein
VDERDTTDWKIANSRERLRYKPCLFRAALFLEVGGIVEQVPQHSGRIGLVGARSDSGAARPARSFELKIFPSLIDPE